MSSSNLIALGKYIQPSLGVDDDISDAVTEQLGVEGVLVFNVQTGLTADAAGLQGIRLDRRGNISPGAIILALNGEAVDDVAALLSKLYEHRGGGEVSQSIWRSGRTIEVPVTLQA